MVYKPNDAATQHWVEKPGRFQAEGGLNEHLGGTKVTGPYNQIRCPRLIDIRKVFAMVCWSKVSSLRSITDGIFAGLHSVLAVLPLLQFSVSVYTSVGLILVVCHYVGAERKGLFPEGAQSKARFFRVGNSVRLSTQ
jgi:hypothetical protein